jgi:hypothetical protein
LNVELKLTKVHQSVTRPGPLKQIDWFATFSVTAGFIHPNPLCIGGKQQTYLLDANIGKD